MKRFFENPTMNISVFDMEDIVTASGGTTTSNLENAEIAMQKQEHESSFAAVLRMTF